MPDPHVVFGIKLKKDISSILDLLAKEIDDMFEVSLYDDIVTRDGKSKIYIDWNVFQYQEFCYSKNQKIKIGIANDDYYMIYLAEVSDVNDVEISDESLLDFIEWKDLLIDQGRIPADSKIILSGVRFL
jgi:hypothetical protein